MSASSVPTKRDFSHLPLRVERSAAGSWRASASIIAMVCSAVVTELPNGVFMTTTPLLGRGGDVDVVDPDSGPADHLEAGPGGQQLRGDLGRRAHREAIVLADDRGELGLAEAGADVGGDAALREVATAAGLRGSAISTLGICSWSRASSALTERISRSELNEFGRVA